MIYLLREVHVQGFSVKLVNSTKKSDYRVEKWHVSKEFLSVTDFENELKAKFTIKGKVTFGYIEPGHGLKGRQHWINDDHDIVDMYRLYKGNKEVIIWCHLSVEPALAKTKRKNVEPTSPQPKRTKCSEKFR